MPYVAEGAAILGREDAEVVAAAVRLLTFGVRRCSTFAARVPEGLAFGPRRPLLDRAVRPVTGTVAVVAGRERSGND
jgi:hypothetical protein